MAAEWTDQKKWWMQVLSSALTFTVGVVVTLSVVDRVTGKRAEDRRKWEFATQLQTGALQDFVEADSLYERTTYDAFESRLGDEPAADEKDEEIIDQWTKDRYPNLRSKLQALCLWFADNKAVQAALIQYQAQLGIIKDEYNCRDRCETLTNVSWDQYRSPNGQLGKLLVQLADARNKIVLAAGGAIRESESASEVNDSLKFVESAGSCNWPVSRGMKKECGNCKP
jgi:hypothetical protein